VRESVWRAFDSSSDGLEVGGIVVDEWHPHAQCCGSDHHVKSPAGQTLLPRLDQFGETAGLALVDLGASP
jgi:hypothetical protein